MPQPSQRLPKARTRNEFYRHTPPHEGLWPEQLVQAAGGKLALLWAEGLWVARDSSTFVDLKLITVAAICMPNRLAKKHRVRLRQSPRPRRCWLDATGAKIGITLARAAPRVVEG
jgi:hypothetical protein